MLRLNTRCLAVVFFGISGVCHAANPEYAFRKGVSNVYDVAYGSTNQSVNCKLVINCVDEHRDSSAPKKAPTWRIEFEYSDFQLKQAGRLPLDESRKFSALPPFRFAADVDNCANVLKIDLRDRLTEASTNAGWGEGMVENVMKPLVACTWECLFPLINAREHSTMDAPGRRDWNALGDSELEKYMFSASVGCRFNVTPRPIGHEMENLIWQSVREMRNAIRLGDDSDRSMETTMEAWYDLRHKQITKARMDKMSTAKAGNGEKAPECGMISFSVSLRKM